MDFYHRSVFIRGDPLPLQGPTRNLPADPTPCCNSAALILDSLDQKKGSVKGLCMAEAKKGKKVGEGARFLKVVVEVLKCKASPPRLPYGALPLSFPELTNTLC